MSHDRYNMLLRQESLHLDTLISELKIAADAQRANVRNGEIAVSILMETLHKFPCNQVVVKRLLNTIMRQKNPPLYMRIHYLLDAIEKIRELNTYDIEFETSYYLFLKNILQQPEKAAKVLANIKDNIAQQQALWED